MPEEPVPACVAGAQLLFHWQAQHGQAGSRGPAGEGMLKGRKGMSSGLILKDQQSREGPQHCFLANTSEA